MKLPVVIALILLPLVFGCSRPRLPKAVDFQTKQKCAELAEAYLKQERSTISSNGANAFIDSEQYQYSPSLDTCLLYFETKEFNSGVSYNIVDLLTHKTRYYSCMYYGPNRDSQRSFDANCHASEGCLLYEAFQAKRAELFNDSN